MRDKLKLVKRTNGEAVPAEVETKAPVSAEKGDEKLVDRVVGEIKDILGKTVQRGMDDVGRLLLKSFFDDDPELYRSFNPTKHASLKLLLERCETMDLPVKKTFLANSLQMAAFGKQLPERSSFFQLPPSHRVELLRLRSPDRAEAFATKAVENKMSVKKIRDAVKKEREKTKSNRGRKKVPDVLLALRQVVRLVKDSETGRGRFKRDDVDQLSDEQKAEGHEAVESAAKRLEELGKLLG
jgi:hypothetical protein